MLSAGFDANIPIHLRTGAWALLVRLTQDIEPTPQYEERYGGSNMDPIAGKAMARDCLLGAIDEAIAELEAQYETLDFERLDKDRAGAPPSAPWILT